MPLKKTDAIFVLGSHDKRVAEYAASLFFKKLAPIMIFSGGIAHSSDLLNTNWDQPEAEILSNIAITKGVPKDKIIIENQAINTGENIIFTKKILKERNIDCQSFILVQKPYIERRAYATFKKQWPEKDFIVTSPPISYKQYTSGNIPKKILSI